MSNLFIILALLTALTIFSYDSLIQPRYLKNLPIALEINDFSVLQAVHHLYSYILDIVSPCIGSLPSLKRIRMDFPYTISGESIT